MGDTVLDLTGVWNDSRYRELSHQILSRSNDTNNEQPSPSFDRLIIDCYGLAREPTWRVSPLILDFFFCVGTCCQLQCIDLNNIGLHDDDHGGRFPIGLLTQALASSASSLNVLSIQYSSLVGTAEDWRKFREAIAELIHLERFMIDTCELIYAVEEEEGNQEEDDDDDDGLEEVTEDTHLDAMLSHISAQETLQQLEFSPRQFVQNLRNYTLERLLTQFTALTDLYLSNVRCLTNDNMICLFNATVENSSLRTLYLRHCILDDTGVRAFVRFLESETSRLRDLNLHLAEAGLSQALHQEDHLVNVFHAFRNNITLRSFDLWGMGAFTPKTTKAYVEMAKANCDLFKFFVTNAPFPECLTMEFYIKLNQLGRKRFLEDYESRTRNDWIDVLAETPDDVRCIYYFLRLNPLLCEV